MNDKQREIALLICMQAGCSEQETKLIMYECEARGIDLGKKDASIIPSGKNKQLVISIGWEQQAAIRTGRYDGCSAPEWLNQNGHWQDYHWSKEGYPYACRMTVHLKGSKNGVTRVAYWSEHFKPTQYGNGSWEKMPCLMLAKCCEAACLRAAFPEDLSGAYIPEEFEGSISELIDEEEKLSITEEIGYSNKNARRKPFTNGVRNNHAQANEEAKDFKIMPSDFMRMKTEMKAKGQTSASLKKAEEMYKEGSLMNSHFLKKMAELENLPTHAEPDMILDATVFNREVSGNGEISEYESNFKEPANGNPKQLKPYQKRESDTPLSKAKETFLKENDLVSPDDFIELRALMQKALIHGTKFAEVCKDFREGKLFYKQYYELTDSCNQLILKQGSSDVLRA